MASASVSRSTTHSSPVAASTSTEKPFATALAPELLDDVRGQPPQVGVLETVVVTPCLDPREVEERLDQPVQPARLLRQERVVPPAGQHPS